MKNKLQVVCVCVCMKKKKRKEELDYLWQEVQKELWMGNMSMNKQLVHTKDTCSFLFYTLQNLFWIWQLKRKLLKFLNISLYYISEFSNKNSFVCVCCVQERTLAKQNTNLHTAQMLILEMSLSSAKISLNSGFFLQRDEIELRLPPLCVVSIKWEIWKFVLIYALTSTTV